MPQGASQPPFAKLAKLVIICLALATTHEYIHTVYWSLGFSAVYIISIYICIAAMTFPQTMRSPQIEPHLQQYYFPPGQRDVAGRPSHSGRWWSRLSIRMLSMIFCAVIIGFSALYYTVSTIGALVMMGPPVILTILWDSVDVLALSCGSRSGIHANACFIVDTILFLGLTAMSGVIAHTVSHLSDSGWYFAFFQDEEGIDYLRIVLGFGFLTAVLHLIVLVMAYLEGKNGGSRAPTAPRIIYVQGTPNGIRDQQLPMEPWQESSPPAYSPTRHEQASSSQDDNQIRHTEPATMSTNLPEKKL
ncbi:hypothetical protein G7046_g7338 [Stylonectria norvegica]|nr:hypothetical protein G7046_g7338 [Stylonectria norvegica]